jgi:hypothetical protein
MREKPTNATIIHLVYLLYISYVFQHYMAIIRERYWCLLRDAQLSISQKALGTLPEDVNVVLKHVVATIHN